MQKRKKFDMTKARVQGTEAAQFVQKNRRAERQVILAPPLSLPERAGRSGSSVALSPISMAVNAAHFISALPLRHRHRIFVDLSANTPTGLEPLSRPHS